MSRVALFALAMCLQVVTPGKTAVASSYGPCFGIPFLAFLERTPMTGTELVHLTAGHSANVDPRLLIAIAQNETHFGTDSGAVTCNQGHNAWGWGATGPGHCAQFPSYASGVVTVSNGLRQWMNLGFTSIDAIAPMYSTNPNWAITVTSIYTSKAGDPRNLNYGWSCCGDCNGDLSVDITELVTLVNVALDYIPETECVRGEANGQPGIQITDLLVSFDVGICDYSFALNDGGCCVAP